MPEVKVQFRNVIKESEYLYVRQTKNYQNRIYGAKKKDGSRAVKKSHNKKRKESYAEDRQPGYREQLFGKV
jgi:hypothetical protein